MGCKKGSRKAEHSGIMGILLRIHPYIKKMPVVLYAGKIAIW